jgi:hypothetical protein
VPEQSTQERNAARLRAAAWRIRTAAPAFADRQTKSDAQTGERWDRGQVLSHVVEMLPYWAEQVRVVTDGPSDVDFGRVKSSPSRLERIASRRGDDPDRLLQVMDEEVSDLIVMLGGMTPEDLARAGRHQTLGSMTVADIVEEFIVGHLEEHADQLT